MKKIDRNNVLILHEDCNGLWHITPGSLGYLDERSQGLPYNQAVRDLKNRAGFDLKYAGRVYTHYMNKSGRLIKIKPLFETCWY